MGMGRTARSLLLLTVLAAGAIATAGFVALRIAPDPPTPLASRAWSLEWFELDGQRFEPVAGHPTTLNLEEDAISGVAVCNAYGADIEFDGGRFRTDELTITLAGCAVDVADLETHYFDALVRAERLVVAPGQLTISGDGLELHFRPRPGG